MRILITSAAPSGKFLQEAINRGVNLQGFFFFFDNGVRLIH